MYVFSHAEIRGFFIAYFYKKFEIEMKNIMIGGVKC